jgi:hypothetical protein
VHIYQRDERCGDQKLIGDGIEQNTERGDFGTPAREVSVSPIGGGREQKHENAKRLVVDRQAPQIDIGAAREKDDYENRNKENAQQRECIRKIHQGLAAKAKIWASDGPRLTIDLAWARVNGSKTATEEPT